MTVSSLSSPAHLSIPVLDPDREGSVLAESLHSGLSEPSSSESELKPGTSGTQQASQSAVVQRQSSPVQQTTAQRPMDQAVVLLPPDIIISRPLFDRGSQTDLHVEEDDTVLVVPKGGGRLSLQ